MSNLRCKICKSTDVTAYTPGIFGDSRHRCNSCGEISITDNFVELTIFDTITVSPEVLAPKFVYCEKTLTDGDIWYSLLLGEIGYPTKAEAVAATVAKLKDVYNDTK